MHDIYNSIINYSVILYLKAYFFTVTQFFKSELISNFYTFLTKLKSLSNFRRFVVRECSSKLSTRVLLEGKVLK